MSSPKFRLDELLEEFSKHAQVAAVQYCMEAAQQNIGDHKTFALYVGKLIPEEANELNLAYDEYRAAVIMGNVEAQKKAVTEIIDGLFDTLWVTLAGILSTTLSVEEVWYEGAPTNIRKIDLETGSMLRRPEDGKFQKPEGWQKPNFRAMAAQVVHALQTSRERQER